MNSTSNHTYHFVSFCNGSSTSRCSYLFEIVIYNVSQKKIKKKKVVKPFIIFEMPNYNHLLTFLNRKMSFGDSVL